MTAIMSRTDNGLGARVVSFNRVTSRPPLPRLLGTVIVHYTGVYRSYETADLGRTVRSIEAWKPGEYNYVIHSDGRIATQAGEFRGAHAAGWNDRAYGILMLCGVGDPCTDAQVESFRWLMGCLKWVGAIRLSAQIVPHRKVAATAVYYFQGEKGEESLPRQQRALRWFNHTRLYSSWD